jgi:hypothetical protein
VFVRSLRRADHSSRGVLPTVLCHCVWSRNLKNEEAKTSKWVVKASKTTTTVSLKQFKTQIIIVYKRTRCASCLSYIFFSIRTFVGFKDTLN